MSVRLSPCLKLIPEYNGGDLKVVDRRVRLAEVILRAVICVLALLAVVLVTTDTQVQEIFTVQKKAKFTDMKALVFLVVANGIAAGYSVLQTVRCGVSMLKGSVLFSKPLAWLIFSCDQIIRYSFFGTKEAFGSTPFWLLWLRYSTFLVLYPTGISSEIGLIYNALPFMKILEDFKRYGSLKKVDNHKHCA